MNTISSLLEFIGNRIATYDADIGVIEVSKASVSSLPTTISDVKIKSSHVVVECVLSNPSAQRDNWAVSTVNGSATISGTISGTTDITLLLAVKTS